MKVCAQKQSVGAPGLFAAAVLCLRSGLFNQRWVQHTWSHSHTKGGYTLFANHAAASGAQWSV